MEPGTIPGLLNYYYTDSQVREEVLRARGEFFNRPDLGPEGKLTLEEKDEGQFNEWFVFNFYLGNGKMECSPFDLDLEICYKKG